MMDAGVAAPPEVDFRARTLKVSLTFRDNYGSCSGCKRVFLHALDIAEEVNQVNK